MDVHHGDPGNQVDQPKDLRLIACPRLSIEHDRIDRYVPAGPTVAEHLRAIGWKLESLQARVFIDGEFIEQACWEYAVPRAGQSFVTRVIPMGGEPGGKSALRIVAMLGVVVLSIFAPYLAPAGLGLLTTAGGVTTLGAFASAAIAIAGSLAMNSLIPAPLPRRALPHPLPARTLPAAA